MEAVGYSSSQNDINNNHLFSTKVLIKVTKVWLHEHVYTRVRKHLQCITKVKKDNF